jgi:hypothetical protein
VGMVYIPPAYTELTHFAIPSRWEIPLDDVLLNGQTLSKPTLQNGVGYTALVDSVSPAP